MISGVGCSEETLKYVKEILFDLKEVLNIEGLEIEQEEKGE